MLGVATLTCQRARGCALDRSEYWRGKLRMERCAFRRRRNGMADSFRKFTVDFALKLSAGCGLADSTPLLEEKWNAFALALIANGENPFLFHRSSARAAFAADDDPMDTTEVYRAKVFE